MNENEPQKQSRKKWKLLLLLLLLLFAGGIIAVAAINSINNDTENQYFGSTISDVTHKNSTSTIKQPVKTGTEKKTEETIPIIPSESTPETKPEETTNGEYQNGTFPTTQKSTETTTGTVTPETVPAVTTVGTTKAVTTPTITTPTITTPAITKPPMTTATTTAVTTSDDTYVPPVRPMPIPNTKRPQIHFDLPDTAYTYTQVSVTTQYANANTLNWSLYKLELNKELPVALNRDLDEILGFNGGNLYFESVGDYKLTATAKNNIATTLYSKKITVVQGLDLRFTTADYTHTDNPITVVMPQENLFGKDVSWSIDPLNTLNLNNTGGSISFDDHGRYTITASSTNDEGTVFTYSKEITVYPIPEITVDVNEYGYVGEDLEIGIQGQHTEGLTYDWEITTGEYSGKLEGDRGIIRFVGKGNYTATVKATDATGRVFTFSKGFEILPVAEISLAIPYNVYSGEEFTVQVEGKELDILTDEWAVIVVSTPIDISEYLSGDIALNGENKVVPVQVSESTAITIKVEAKDVNNRLYEFSSQTTIRPVPVIDFSMPDKCLISDEFNVVVNSVTGTENAPIVWSIVKDGGAISYSGTLNESGGKIMIAAEGVYELRASVTNDLGRTFVYSKTITILSPSIKITAPDVVYSGEPFNTKIIGENLDGFTVSYYLLINEVEKPVSDCFSGTVTLGDNSIIPMDTINTRHISMVAKATNSVGASIVSLAEIDIKPIPQINFTVPISSPFKEDFDITIDSITGTENAPIVWGLAKGGEAIDYIGEITENGGKIRVEEEGSYTLSASVTNDVGRVFNFSSNIEILKLKIININQVSSGSSNVTVTYTTTSFDEEFYNNGYPITPSPSGASIGSGNIEFKVDMTGFTNIFVNYTGGMSISSGSLPVQGRYRGDAYVSAKADVPLLRSYSGTGGKGFEFSEGVGIVTIKVYSSYVCDFSTKFIYKSNDFVYSPYHGQLNAFASVGSVTLT